MTLASSEPTPSGLSGANQAWRAETWLLGPCLWSQAGLEHTSQQEHGVGDGSSTLRGVHGWRTTADPAEEFCHAVYCTNLPRETTPIPKDQVVVERRSPHHRASCPLHSPLSSVRDKFLPIPKIHQLLTINWDETGRYFPALDMAEQALRHPTIFSDQVGKVQRG